MRFNTHVQKIANTKCITAAIIVSVEIINENTIDNIANTKYILEGRQKEEILNFIFINYIFTKYIIRTNKGSKKEIVPKYLFG